jgi:hypothetical protein
MNDDSMTTRSTITLGLLIVLGFAVVVVLRFFDAGERVATAVVPAPSHSSGVFPSATAKAPSIAEPAKTADMTRRVEPADAGAVGQANGAIHFQRQPVQGNGQAAGKDARIDFDVHSALGVWQPGENLMRIVLLETAPKGDEVARMLDALQAGGVGSVAKRMAVIELRFIPTAQAFDRNELDSARLVVSDGTLTSSADALNSLRWEGSLPSPQMQLPAGSDNPTVALTSASESVTADRETWMQSWRLSLTVPVIMRK